jgi:DNA-binding IclR family transcriptional regulator
MAHWGKKEVTFGEMNQVLEQAPGQTASDLARNLGVPCSTVTRRLPSMSEVGYKLYEDDKGRLYPFDPQKL